MNLRNERMINETNDSVGYLYVFNPEFKKWNFLYNTLQPSVNRKNNLGYQAMDEGKYTLIPFFSPAFQYLVPLFDVDITDQVDIDSRRFEIHPMNSSKDTKGCTGLGDYVKEDWIEGSVARWKEFMKKYFLPATRTKSLAILKAQEKLHSLGMIACWELVILEGLPGAPDDFITIEVINKFE